MSKKIYGDRARLFVKGLRSSSIPEAIHKAVLAQWILESNHFRSRLCVDANNAGGMKYRKGYHNDVGSIQYTDWEQKEDAYFRLNRPEDYADLYWWFVTRDRYKGAIERAGHGDAAGFIFELARAGYVASMPGVVPEEIPAMYLSKIQAIASRPETEELYRSEWTDGVAALMGAKNEISYEELPEWASLYGIGEVEE